MYYRVRQQSATAGNMSLINDETHLLRERDRGQQAPEVEPVALSISEGQALGVFWVPHEVHATDDLAHLL